MFWFMHLRIRFVSFPDRFVFKESKWIFISNLLRNYGLVGFPLVERKLLERWHWQSLVRFFITTLNFRFLSLIFSGWSSWLSVFATHPFYFKT